MLLLLLLPLLPLLLLLLPLLLPLPLPLLAVPVAVAAAATGLTSVGRSRRGRHKARLVPSLSLRTADGRRRPGLCPLLS